MQIIPSADISATGLGVGSNDHTGSTKLSASFLAKTFTKLYNLLNLVLVMLPNVPAVTCSTASAKDHNHTLSTSRWNQIILYGCAFHKCLI
jgi:hypothetical protein